MIKRRITSVTGRKNRRFSIALYIGAMAVLAMIGLALPAQADSIAITYSLTGVGTVQSATETTLTLAAQASGSVLSGDPVLNAAWNPVTYSDQAVLDFNTGLLNGTFTLSFANGQAVNGTVFEDNTAILASPSQTGPFTQTLTFTGGTGGFAGATGSFSGQGLVGATDFTVSGSGTINASAVPEPSSILLLLSGLTPIILGARQSRSQVRARTAPGHLLSRRSSDGRHSVRGQSRRGEC